MRLMNGKANVHCFLSRTWPVVQGAHVNIGAILHHNYFHISLFDAKPKFPSFPGTTWSVVEGAHVSIGAILKHDY